MVVLTTDMVLNLQKMPQIPPRSAASGSRCTMNEETAAKKRREELDKLSQSEQRCDLLAANPNDQNRVGEGVSFDALKSQAKDAVEVCDTAAKEPEGRHQFHWRGLCN